MDSPETDNFDGLRRLLALKKHEQPPPGFYAGFADRVRSRIQAEERRRPAPWWAGWFARLEWRPVLSGACAVAACAIVVLKLSQAPVDARGFQPALAGAMVPAQPAPMLPVLAAETAPGPGNAASAEAVPSSFSPVLASKPPAFMFKTGWGMQRRAPEMAAPGAVPASLEVPAPAVVSTGAAGGLVPVDSGR